ncbi:hypothetical protein B0H19DRAFT_1274704 [Mycena capillaripes]|nr:hypothetical protein B0H19DRAFT_1274704 [Mycena capillaripes]
MIENNEQQAPSPDSMVPAVRHPRYYFNDGGIVFMCEGVLYRLHKSRLAKKSEFFEHMFEIPQSNLQEGLDDQHPVLLPDSNIDFQHLLEFLYDQDEIENPSLEYYISILHMSRNLVCRRLTSITQADAENMGVVAYHKLVQVHCAVEELDLGLAFNPPTVFHSPGCLDENVCTRLWETAWWMGYAKQLLHPENVKDRFMILDSMDRSKGIVAHMGPHCLTNTLASIWEENPFNDDEGIVTQASAELKAWMEKKLD